MRITLFVRGAPYTTDGPRSALKFAEAALAAGHEIHRVFFYNDAVLIGNRFAVVPQDESDLTRLWVDFGKNNRVELTICIAASLRRGILSKTESDRYDLTGSSVDDGFEIVGLGQMIEGMLSTDRTVTFGA